MVICVTLSGIKKHGPCPDELNKLIAHLGLSEEDIPNISLATIIDSNGVDEAIWCLCAVSGHDKKIRLFAVWCARQVQHLMADKRSVDAIDVSEQYALGAATEDDLRSAWSSACDAAMAATRPCENSASWSAVWSAAEREAAGGAAWATARAAVRAAARAAARSAEKAEALGDAMAFAQEKEFRRAFCSENHDV